MRWASELAATRGWIALGTEASVGANPPQFVRIAAVAWEGRRGGDVLLDALVRPVVPVRSGACAVHGLSDEDLEGVSTFRELYPELISVLDGRRVIAYDAPDARRVYQASLGRENLPDCRPHHRSRAERPWECAMRAYASYLGTTGGETDRRRDVLARPMPQLDGHGARDRARAALALVLRMAGVDPDRPPYPLDPDAMNYDVEDYHDRMVAERVDPRNWRNPQTGRWASEEDTTGGHST